MNRKITFLLIGLTLFINQVIGQTFKEQMYSLVSKNDTAGQQQLLEKWEKTDNNDPDLFVAYFYFYVSKMEIPQYKRDYNKIDLLSKALYWINKGIEKHPNRLDMRFQKIDMFRTIGDFGNATKEIIKTIEYSSENKNNWTLDYGNPPYAKHYMLSTLVATQYQFFYEAEFDSSRIDKLKLITETVLKYYPDHRESSIYLSRVFILKKQYEKALEPLLKAEKINPKSISILCNISEVYILQKQYDKALKSVLKAKKLNPKNDQILWYVARAYNSKGDKLNAIKHYELCIKNSDGFNNARQEINNILDEFILQKQYDKALKTLLKAKKMYPEDSLFLLYIARAYNHKDDKRNAVKYYELFLKKVRDKLLTITDKKEFFAIEDELLFPIEQELFDISKEFIIQKQFDKGLEPLLKAKELYPDNTYVLWCIAKEYNLKGDKMNAIKFYELFIKNPKSPKVMKWEANLEIEELKMNNNH